MHIALINAPLKSTVCDYSIGHQIPLGLLMVGGPLLDAGFQVTLIDGARDYLSGAETARRVAEMGADVVMISHVGSTQAHPCCMHTLRAIKAASPSVVTVYGGVHPSYHYTDILMKNREVDIIVRGEGEVTALELLCVLADAQKGQERREELFSSGILASVQGVVWRCNGQVTANPTRPPIQDLDAWRIGWELIEDWDRYQAFGLGRAAVVQFSRGCPHTCTYCGQWMFWKRWRHRDTIAFVDEVERLHKEHQVNYFWLADENPTTDKAIWKGVLEEIIRRGLDISLSATIRSQDIVRDADLMPLYKQAGFIYILLGLETVTDENMDKIRKGSCVNDGYQAVRLLRRHHIMSVVDYIFGIDEETPRTLWRGLRGLLYYDGDVVNVLYLTPHAWTPLGKAMKDAPIIEPDLWKWDYRHQVIGVPQLTPSQLFLGVKLIEFLYHLHPRRLWAILTASDPRMRRQLRFCIWNTLPWFWMEVYEHIADRLTVSRKRAARLLP